MKRGGRGGHTAIAAVMLMIGTSLSAQSSSRPELLIRIDDIGMNHSVNMALQQLADTKMPLSASVLFVCPWYQEAVDILHKNPQISVGVHLALNSEWKWYRWGPVLGKEAVPSLVDSVGYFFASSDEFLAHKYDLGEVERELSAQVERALRSGLKIDYVDFHMGTAAGTPELLAVAERIAAKYQLGMSPYFGEAEHSMFDVPIAQKQSAFRAYVDTLTPGPLNLAVIHVAQSTPEIQALVDMNNATQNSATGDPLMSRHRQAELDMLLQFARGPQSRKVALINYAGVIARLGRASMKRPATQ